MKKAGKVLGTIFAGFSLSILVHLLWPMWGYADSTYYNITEMGVGEYAAPAPGDQIWLKNDTDGNVWVHFNKSTKKMWITNSGWPDDATNSVQFAAGDNKRISYSEYLDVEGGSGQAFTVVVNDWALNPEPTPTQKTSSPLAHVHTFTWQTIYEATPNSDGLEGEVCSCGATRNTQPISAMDYAINKYADQMIKAAKPGQKITLEFGEFNSFPRHMMEKVAARMNENITFVFKFKQNKKMQTVTIEPGTAIDLQYDWYGPDKMKELYGAE